MALKSESKGLVIAAPQSGAGKTTVTLALLRLLRERGLSVMSLKAGPDYIDPAFHEAASGRPCYNVDSWAMRRKTLDAVQHLVSKDSDLVILEGAMGLYDGARGGGGSTAEIATLFDWPVVMVVDAKGIGASVAALLQGYRDYDPSLKLAGVLFNRIGSRAHLEILEEAIRPLGMQSLGGLPRNDALGLPGRHLGLVQAEEHPDLEKFIASAAAYLEQHLDLDALLALPARGRGFPGIGAWAALDPIGQRIAVARDQAFRFSYPHVLEGWRRAGAEVSFFSPLADEAPRAEADAVYLPGGYPELHAGRLASNSLFRSGLLDAARAGLAVHGECGGYMTLGQGLEDAEGQRHPMLGLLPLETSFARRRLSLGYRRLRLCGSNALGAAGRGFRGHEFHYATILGAEGGDPLFHSEDARGRPLARQGARVGSVMGSFVHLIDHDDRAAA